MDPKIVAINPCTGAVLREATDAEREAYEAQPCNPALRRPVRIGDVTIDESPAR